MINPDNTGVFLTVVAAVLTLPILWVVWITLIESTIRGRFAGIEGASVSLFDRILVGYLGLMILGCDVALWSDALSALRGR